MCLRTGTDRLVDLRDGKGRDTWYRIILRWILRTWKGLRARTGLIWLRVGTGSHCCKQGDEPSVSIKREIYWLAEILLTSQEGLYRME
jgi:hypothetical protein